MKRARNIRLFSLLILCGLSTFGFAEKNSSFRFSLTGDPRSGLSKWRHCLKQMKERTNGDFAFHVTAGDYFEDDRSTMAYDFYDALTGEFGADVKWYPGVGNHELKGGAIDVVWLKQYYRDHLMGEVNPGPPGCNETTYSWDYENAHFVQLDMYCENGKYEDNDGAYSDWLYNWLVKDLEDNNKPVVFVIYHEPAFPNGRGGKDHSPEGWKRFMKLLNDRKVVAGFCAHTHTYGRYQVDGDWTKFTWEVDAGNAGRMSHGDKHQTFVDIKVCEDGTVRFDTWQGLEGEEFRKTDSWSVKVPVETSASAK